MQKQKETIAVIHDSVPALEAVRAALSSYYAFSEIPLEKYVSGGAVNAAVNIFCADFDAKGASDQVNKALKICEGATLFVLPTGDEDSAAPIRQGAKSSYFTLPLDSDRFRASLIAILNKSVEKTWSTLEPLKRKALKSAVASFEKCFDQVANGEPIPLEDIKNSCEHIRRAAELGGLDSWISALDDHHDYSFRHSMFVCGTLTYFAHAMGIRGTDLDALTLGGLLHDIGKCRIPLSILDKPGKLDDSEWKIMKQHPVHSREILELENDLEKNLIGMAVYHHEKLDGTGYPDGLSGLKINDHVRLTSIADVYAALIDRRAYKGAMPSEKALDLMSTLKYQLDMDLLREFRSFTLDKG